MKILSFVMESYGKRIIFNFNTQVYKWSFCVDIILFLNFQFWRTNLFHILKSVYKDRLLICDFALAKLTRLRLGLSHLNEHKFKHNFQDCINPLCTCSWEIESFFHFFLHCHYFTNIPSTLFSELQPVDVKIAKFSDNEIVQLRLYGSPKFDSDQNRKLSSFCGSFILKSESFYVSLLQKQMELVDNKTSGIDSHLICQSDKYS